MRILVTGATGYIGQRVVALAARSGHEVVAATRQRPLNLDLPWTEFDFARPQSFVMPSAVDVVVHLAAVTTASDVGPEAEIGAARRLVEEGRRAGARLIFVSSQVARHDAPTPYGRIKWSIEQMFAEAGGISIRPGQVYGGPERGLFGLLVRLVRALPVLPAFLPAPQIQPIHVDDLASGILATIERGAPFTGVLCLGSPVPISFTMFLATIAQERLNSRCIFVPVPTAIVLFGVNLLGSSLAARLGLDKLKSLFEVPPMETAGDLDSLGLTLRPIASGIVKSGDSRRRQLAAEGRALLGYILGHRPASAIVRRYVRVIETLRKGQSLGLAAFFLRNPAFLALLDTPASRSTPNHETGWRLCAAMIIAEATAEGAQRFLGNPARSLRRPFAATLSIVKAITLTAFWRLMSALAGPWLPKQPCPRPDRHHDA